MSIHSTEPSPASAPEDVRRGRRSWLPAAALERLVLPIVTPLCGILLWEALVRLYRLPPSLLPAPSAVWERLADTYPVILDHAVPTAIESALGFLLATGLGIALALALTYSRLFSSAIYPSVIFFQLIPKIALAPLFVVWLGIGAGARLAFAVFISFFPIVIATEAGLRSAPADMLRLCRGLTASNWQVFLWVRLPYAVPYIFSGMKIAVTFAIIGVIVGEFITAQKGLGYLIIFASSQADTALILAAILVLCLIGLGFFGLVVAAEKLASRWYGSG